MQAEAGSRGCVSQSHSSAVEHRRNEVGQRSCLPLGANSLSRRVVTHGTGVVRSVIILCIGYEFVGIYTWGRAKRLPAIFRQRTTALTC